VGFGKIRWVPPLLQRLLCALVFAHAAILWGPPAAAQEFEPLTDRDYGIDLYQGAALGSVGIVGMGGAAIATGEGSAGISSNPAAAAVRPETSTRVWDWDWHFDALNPVAGTDLDNNGILTESAADFRPALTAGLVGQYRQWALGVSGSFATQVVQVGEGAGADHIRASASALHLTLARSFARRQVTAGVGAVIGGFGLGQVGVSQELFHITGATLEAGAVWRPPDRDLRIGVSGRLPVSGDEVEVDACPPTDCAGYVLPEAVRIPWRAGVGAAWRRANTRWNRKIDADWRDERYLLLAADLVVTGAVRDGHGIEAFSRMQLQPSGRSAAVSIRGGAEYEWVPGWFRVRGGSYWEPSRFLDPTGRAVPGRLHLTAGFDLRVWSFCFWNDRYRVRLSLTADVADNYSNAGVSIGFWH
jgi:hypothetical protein